MTGIAHKGRGKLPTSFNGSVGTETKAANKQNSFFCRFESDYDETRKLWY